jgi:hypothetical protein
MMSSVVGLGTKYGAAYEDSDGAYLRGENKYRIDLPGQSTGKRPVVVDRL